MNSDEVLKGKVSKRETKMYLNYSPIVSLKSY